MQREAVVIVQGSNHQFAEAIMEGVANKKLQNYASEIMRENKELMNKACYWKDIASIRRTQVYNSSIERISKAEEQVRLRQKYLFYGGLIGFAAGVLYVLAMIALSA